MTKKTKGVNFNQNFRSIRRESQVHWLSQRLNSVRWNLIFVVLSMEIKSGRNSGNFWKMFGLLHGYCIRAILFLFRVTNF